MPEELVSVCMCGCVRILYVSMPIGCWSFKVMYSIVVWMHFDEGHLDSHQWLVIDVCRAVIYASCV